MVEFKCLECDKDFDSREALDMHNQAKHEVIKQKKGLTDKQKRKIRNWSIFLLITILIIGGIIYLIINVKNLPPNDFQGHIEDSPPSHIMREPMNILVQRHMIEHSDGTGPPGIIINYNCIDYECEGDLISNLEAFAERYTSNVYVAPFPNMDAKIALTRYRKIEILDNYNQQEIEDFINSI